MRLGHFRVPAVWTIKKKRLLDLFVTANYGFLALDILYAHSVNRFAHEAEYLPLFFSILAALALGLGMLLPWKVKAYISFTTGAASVVVGALGIFFHLESQFFQSKSFMSLTYTAPLVAPLAYTSLGLLLFLNRFVSSIGRSWGAWVYLIAYFGFCGNFLLSLLDHYQNRFFYPTEWIPVVASAALVGIGPFYLARHRGPAIQSAVIWLNRLQAVVGVLGFSLHLYGILNHGSSVRFLDRILYGAPLLAPLLFVNLAVLLAIGMKGMDQPEKVLVIRFGRS